MTGLHPLFAAAIKPFAPPVNTGPCSECGKPLPAVYFGPTNWMADGVCSKRCWEDQRMEGPRHEPVEDEQ